MAKVKRIRSRSSGTFHVLANAEIIRVLLSVVNCQFVGFAKGDPGR
jgi:hypothetical protein